MSLHFVPHLDTLETLILGTPVEWVLLSHAHNHWNQDRGWHFLGFKAHNVLTYFKGSPIVEVEPMTITCMLCWRNGTINCIFYHYHVDIVLENAHIGMHEHRFLKQRRYKVNSRSSMTWIMTYVAWHSITPPPQNQENILKMQWKLATVSLSMRILHAASSLKIWTSNQGVVALQTLNIYAKVESSYQHHKLSSQGCKE
jgi:hypothetical protein